MTHEHSDECECGCGCHDEHGPELYPPYAALGTVGFLIMAVSMLSCAIVCLLAYGHDGDVNWDTSINTFLVYTYAITAICLLALSAYGLHKGVYSESLMFIIYAVFTLVTACSLNEGALTGNVSLICGILLGVLLLIPAVVFLLNKEGLLGFAVFVYAIALMISDIVALNSNEYGLLIFGIGSVISCVILAYIAVANLLYAESGKNLPLF